MFNFAYDNFKSVQRGVDWVGKQLDIVREIISSGFSAINPMNWAW